MVKNINFKFYTNSFKNNNIFFTILKKQLAKDKSIFLC